MAVQVQWMVCPHGRTKKRCCSGCYRADVDRQLAVQRYALASLAAKMFGKFTLEQIEAELEVLRGSLPS